MSIDRKEKLVELGADQLADALLELASRDDAADDLVKRMMATPQENVKRFKAKLSGIKRRRSFVPYGASGAFARELGSLLEDIEAGVSDPRTGAELVASFYECDDGALGCCDDSNGSVGDVFREEARELFVGYASRCTDKKWLGNLVFRVIQSDDYGVRDTLVDCASEYLPEPVLRSMVQRLQERAALASDEYGKRHWLNMVESLARQLKDAPLFEQTRLASWGSLSTAACVDIARVYLECDDAETALTWLAKIPATESYMANERDDLLMEIYGSLGNASAQGEVAWRSFRRFRSILSLDRLLGVIGQDQKAAVVEGEAAVILGHDGFSSGDAAFLVDAGRIDDAEVYVLDRAAQLNGDYYGALLPLAQAMEKAGRPVCATLLYRALLDSILRRGQTTSYNHGVRYLRKLDSLALSVSDWRGIASHAVYKDDIRKLHGRKSSFWSRYQP